MLFYGATFEKKETKRRFASHWYKSCPQRHLHVISYARKVIV